MGSTSVGTVRYGLLGLVSNPRTAAGILTVQLYSYQSSTRASTMNSHVATSVLCTYEWMGSTRTGTVRYGLPGLVPVPNPRTAAGDLGGLCYPLLYGCTRTSTRSGTLNSPVATSVLYVLLDSSYEYRYGTIRYARSSTMNSHVATDSLRRRSVLRLDKDTESTVHDRAPVPNPLPRTAVRLGSCTRTAVLDPVHRPYYICTGTAGSVQLCTGTVLAVRIQFRLCFRSRTRARRSLPAPAYAPKLVHLHLVHLHLVHLHLLLHVVRSYLGTVVVQLYGSSCTSSTAGVVDSVRECGCIQVDSVSLSNRRTGRRRSDYSPATRGLPAVLTQSSIRVICAVHVLAVSCGTTYCGTVSSIPVPYMLSVSYSCQPTVLSVSCS
jgi:hypothetical protein